MYMPTFQNEAPIRERKADTVAYIEADGDVIRPGQSSEMPRSRNDDDQPREAEHDAENASRITTIVDGANSARWNVDYWCNNGITWQRAHVLHRLSLSFQNWRVGRH